MPVVVGAGAGPLPPGLGEGRAESRQRGGHERGAVLRRQEQFDDQFSPYLQVRRRLRHFPRVLRHVHGQRGAVDHQVHRNGRDEDAWIAGKTRLMTTTEPRNVTRAA